MSQTDDIFSGLNGKPFSVFRFYREHQIGILGTVSIHLIVLIVFLLAKIQSFKHINELDLVMEFIEIPVEDSDEKLESREEFLERLIEQQLSASNQAVNEVKMEEEISTEKYVEEFLQELEKEKDEAWKLKNEEMQEFLNQEDVVPINEVIPEENENAEFSGPTNISYEFLSEPKKRVSVNLPVPVYKCRGYGEVEVLVVVNNIGNVISAKATIISASEDPECLSDISETYALRSVFRGDASAPSQHKAKIHYTFISQE